MSELIHTGLRIRKDVKKAFYTHARKRGILPAVAMREAIYDKYMDWLLEEENSENKEVMKKC